ncbi:MAG: hypothetical protein ABIG93_02660 [archaeon]|nr:hypothetical protein [Nanoarchaeota archaeon]
MEKKSCCSGNKEKKKSNSFWQGLMYGLIPHTGCILFIIGSILGVTVLTNFFKPMLMNRYFFHALVGVSLGFATLSSVLYLRKHKFLSWAGVKKKWKYLSVMYGSTIGINLFLFMLIFPLLANVSAASPTGAFAAGSDFDDLSSISLKVNIPCPGHAPLISEELKTIAGVSSIQFSFPNNFDVTYDPTQTSKEEILALEVFETYSAEVTDESTGVSSISLEQESDSYTASSCSSCTGDPSTCDGSGTCSGGAASSCGSSGGSCSSCSSY